MSFFPAAPSKKKPKPRRLVVFPLLVIIPIMVSIGLVAYSTTTRQPITTPVFLTSFAPTPLPSLILTVNSPTAASTTLFDTTQQIEAQALLKQVNAVRQTNGAPPLVLNEMLMTAALRHSMDMAAGSFISHTGSDGSDMVVRVERVSYMYRALGENVLVRPDQNADGAFDQWWNSPAHRDNMLNPNFAEMGLAFAAGADGSYYYTMLLGTRF